MQPLLTDRSINVLLQSYIGLSIWSDLIEQTTVTAPNSAARWIRKETERVARKLYTAVANKGLAPEIVLDDAITHSIEQYGTLHFVKMVQFPEVFDKE